MEIDKNNIRQILVDVYGVDGRLEDEAAERIFRLINGPIEDNSDSDDEDIDDNDPSLPWNFRKMQ